MIRIVPAPGSYISIGGNVNGGLANRVLFTDSNGALAQSANLTYSDTLSLGSTPGIQVGSGSTTSAGFLIGNSASGYASLWNTGLTPSSGNWILAQGSAGDSYFNGTSLTFRTGGTDKFNQLSTAGRGIYLLPGTATTDVQALSATQTWNNGAVAFTHEKHLITDTASAAGSLAVAYFGGASASTILFSVDKSGVLQFGTTYSAGVVSATGTIQVKDATGTTYNVLVHT